jgi:hypothetical protein
MRLAACFSLPLEPTKTTYYLGRETLLTNGSSPMSPCQHLSLDGSGC